MGDTVEELKDEGIKTLVWDALACGSTVRQIAEVMHLASVFVKQIEEGMGCVVLIWPAAGDFYIQGSIAFHTARGTRLNCLLERIRNLSGYRYIRMKVCPAGSLPEIRRPVRWYTVERKFEAAAMELCCLVERTNRNCGALNQIEEKAKKEGIQTALSVFGKSLREKGLTAQEIQDLFEIPMNEIQDLDLQDRKEDGDGHAVIWTH